MTSGKSLNLCQTPSEVRRFLEEHPAFLEKILKGTEENISISIKNIISPAHNTRYASDNKEFLYPQDKIKELQNYTPSILSSKLNDNIYKELSRYTTISKDKISFKDLGNVLETNKKLLEWTVQNDTNQIIENIFGETADQRFEQERLGLSPQIRISHFYNSGSHHTTKILPDGYFVDKVHKIYTRDITNNTYTVIQGSESEYPLTIVDYDEQLGVFSSRSRIDKKKSLNIFYKLYSFQNNTIQSVDNREYLDIKFNNGYTSFVNKDDGIIHIIIHSDENKTEYKLQPEEEKLNDIKDIFYSKEDDCILVYSNAGAYPSYYLVFGDGTIFSDVKIDPQYYEHIVFEKGKLEFIAPYQKKSFFDRFITKKMPEYLAKYDEGHVHHIDLQELHKFLQKNK